jgi:hypothetical protein
VDGGYIFYPGITAKGGNVELGSLFGLGIVPKVRRDFLHGISSMYELISTMTLVVQEK